MTMTSTKDYWYWPGYSNYSKIRGRFAGTDFYFEGHPNAEQGLALGKNLFQSELECIETIISKRKDEMEVLRFEIDKLEEKKSPLLKQKIPVKVLVD